MEKESISVTPQVGAESLHSSRRWACALGAMSSFAYVVRGSLNCECQGADVADAISRAIALCYSVCGVVGASSKSPRTTSMCTRLTVLLGLVLSGSHLPGWCADHVEWAVASILASLFQIATAYVTFPNMNRILLLIGPITCIACGFGLHMGSTSMLGDRESEDPANASPIFVTCFWVAQSLLTLAGTIAGNAMSSAPLEFAHADIEKGHTKKTFEGAESNDDLEKTPSTASINMASPIVPVTQPEPKESDSETADVPIEQSGIHLEDPTSELHTFEEIPEEHKAEDKKLPGEDDEVQTEASMGLPCGDSQIGSDELYTVWSEDDEEWRTRHLFLNQDIFKSFVAFDASDPDASDIMVFRHNR
eukprot:gnl/TRDRNA2_/TRDRNA2_33097_c0_seq1.p1 gnl/TRDRNA2_/TRDRNA2_33097_c0~~gnl/TRDRNA2_/TRDRNA2_33097_c0_seq1.p1  ORF type:complete len:363 (-),score=65.52 gnl/TRDRNA2_/TRDRNA2_33097_c0_seq1:90-1178(-)